MVRVNKEATLADNQQVLFQQPVTSAPRSLTRLLAIFDALAVSSEGLTLAELSVFLGSPKSSLLNLLRPLVAEAYLVHNGVTYHLGPAIFRLAAGVFDTWDLPRAIRPFMQKLAELTGESVLLSVMNVDQGTMTYIDILDSPHPVRYQIAVGTVRPLYASTAGRVLLAYTERGWRQQYLSALEITVATAVPITLTSLRRDLNRIVEHGLGWSIDGYMVGLSAVGAPLFDKAGRCIACLNIAGPTDRFAVDIERFKKMVKQTADAISASLSA